MTTMTGLLGLNDNSNGFNAKQSKVITIAAGESYVYTFVNYNKGAEGANVYENWVVEGRRSDNNHCFDFRADGGFWTWKPDADEAVLTASYTGSNSANVSTTAKDWLTAYNGVTVTLTITRSADGNTMTVEHSATTNNSTTYAGTFTCTGFGTGAATFLITNELSHQNITKVVYTDASGAIINYELKDIDLSKFDSYGTGSYADGVASIKLAQYGWSKLDLTSYFSNIEGTITNVNIKLSENIYGEGRFTLGIFGDTKTSWANKQGYQDANNSVSVWGVMGRNKATRIYNTGTGNTNYVANKVTLDAVANIEVDMDMINKKFTWIQDGTTQINNLPFVDTQISQPNYIAAYSWVAEGSASTISNATMEIVYLEASYYTATFNNTTSGNSPTVTIYSDSERSNEIANGLLENGKTYYFTATEEGYQDYNGEFTVSGTDPEVNFAMTAKAVYNYTVNAIGAEDAIIKAGVLSGTCYANESTSFYLPTCVLADETLHFMAAESSYKSETVASDNQVFSYAYTTNNVENVVFFTEGENINGASTSIPSGNQNLASEGKMGRGSNLTVTTLPAGQYTIYVHYINTNSSGHSLLIKAGDDEVMNETGITVRPTKNASFILSEEKTLTLTAAGSSTSGVDYLYIVKTGEANENVVVSDAGYATYVSENNLDFSNATTKAYKVKVNTKGVATLTEVEKVPANTPVLLYAENGNGSGETIPVAATADAVEDNDLVAGAGATVATTDGDYTNMILNNVNNKVGFYFANNQMVATNRAYLHILTILAPDAVTGARMQIVFDNETSGIKSVNNALNESGNYFNLSGQRISEPAKGLYIVNGKKVIIK